MPTRSSTSAKDPITCTQVQVPSSFLICYPHYHKHEPKVVAVFCEIKESILYILTKKEKNLYYIECQTPVWCTHSNLISTNVRLQKCAKRGASLVHGTTPKIIKKEKIKKKT